MEYGNVIAMCEMPYNIYHSFNLDISEKVHVELKVIKKSRDDVYGIWQYKVLVKDRHRHNI